MRVDGWLVAAARAHSTDMVTNHFFDHTGSNGSNFVQREAAAGYTTGASAENIAWEYRTGQDVVNGWINSPGHRAKHPELLERRGRRRARV
ncbi:CAP domain-containing protein [Dactylosporangium sp. NPDC048998]|uniref:CAP domain-containing protein n=1 Tax=Dactylosporangium sp. NPDC048998 TaxID=3363976 RepID=UPI00371E4F8D